MYQYRDCLTFDMGRLSLHYFAIDLPIHSTSAILEVSRLSVSWNLVAKSPIDESGTVALASRAPAGCHGTASALNLAVPSGWVAPDTCGDADCAQRKGVLLPSIIEVDSRRVARPRAAALLLLIPSGGLSAPSELYNTRTHI